MENTNFDFDFSFENTENNYYIITGSGNANSEASIEQYQIENNKKIFDFYKTLF